MASKKNEFNPAIDKLSMGIEIHGKRLRIAFRFKGQRYRELDTAIPKGEKITWNHITHAERLRASVMLAIQEGRFNYSEFFPDSVKSRDFEDYANKGRTVQEGVTAWLDDQKTTCAPSTYKAYESRAGHITNHFGNVKIVDVTHSKLKRFRNNLLKTPRHPNDPESKPLSPKSVNEICTILRGVWADAFADGIIKTNSMDRIINIRHESDNEADPFDLHEISLILGTHTQYKQELNMAMFNMFTGLSISELIALAWEDVDLDRGIILVRRARVKAEYKVPKETYRVREVELLPPALAWLKEQRIHTFMKQPVEISVRQRNNISFKSEKVRFVFLKSSTGRAHPSDGSVREDFWIPHLRKANVRYRGSNQWRHTFASMMLSQYVPQEWIARQLGHKDTKMLIKHYGKWIPQDTSKMANTISTVLGFEVADRSKHLGQNWGKFAAVVSHLMPSGQRDDFDKSVSIS